MIVVFVQIQYSTHDMRLLTYRFNDGNQFGRVKSAGQSFIAPVSKNGLPIHWERE